MLTDLALWIAFRDTPGLRRDAARQLLERYGEPAQIFGRPPLDLGDLCPARAARALWAGPGPLLEAARAELRLGERSGLRLLHRGEPDFPPLLAEIPDAPLVLWLRGELPDPELPVVAIVGSRACPAYGRAVARHFASELARAGLVIVSGLAYGIDAAAHRAALDAGGRSVAVSACGIDRAYPAEHRGLASKIAASGALVSEFPPATHPRREFFPLRNRLISGMSMALLVVEARERSGSLVTARHAANQGITVFAVPGPIDAATSRGTNRLLREGAWVATEPADLLAELGSSAASPAEQHARGVDDRGRAILDALRDAPATRDELARRLGASAAMLALPLLELELTRHVEEDRDGQLRVVASRSEL